VSFSGTVADPDDTTKGLEGWTWCELAKPDNCVTTDATGAFELKGLPANADVAVAGDKDGIYPILRIFHTTSAGQRSQMEAYFTDQTVADWLDAAGLSEDDSRGLMGLFIGGPAGSSISITPESGTLVYANETVPDPTLTASPGLMTPYGVGSTAVAYNAEPDEYQVTFATPDGDCVPGGDTWPGSDAASARAQVVAGRFTYGVYATCTAPPTLVETHASYADVAECEADTDMTATSACQGCNCQNCLDELNDCRAAAGCFDIVLCAGEKQCAGTDCGTADTCLDVINAVPGGVSGASTMAATAVSDCSIANCPDDCPVPATP